MGVHSDVLAEVLVEVDIRIQRLKDGAMVAADDQYPTLTVKRKHSRSLAIGVVVFQSLPINKKPKSRRILNLNTSVNASRAGLLESRVEDLGNGLGGVCRLVKGVDALVESEMRELSHVAHVGSHD